MFHPKAERFTAFRFFHFFNDNAHHAAPRQNLVAPGKVFLQNMTPEKPLPLFLS
ncbi:Hypothetical protein BSSP2_II0082 [Brucella suis bv. 2]|nr:Hypothetical protein BSSP3_II0082 [Brucella suis bv. 2]AIB22162.1 Hypothetical protein BSPT1_II0082 [Brucella suis bv. 2]AIB25517.1 Hypothetical protein BSPT2_II0082 [Brucella suis bv. 2]AIB28909.1 Hypothetical protein BSSP1_II0082 [Brucella suis bv. 2]AIB32277.1 Hypothetical protein BSSP2_II0082 [Brucella suis bv. 2]